MASGNVRRHTTDQEFDLSYSASGDPFGVLATIIPVFLLAIVLGEGTLIPVTKAGSFVLIGVFVIMGAGEVAALFGLTSGGSSWSLTLARFGALVGVVSVVSIAVFHALPPTTRGRWRDRSATNLVAYEGQVVVPLGAPSVQEGGEAKGMHQGNLPPTAEHPPEETRA